MTTAHTNIQLTISFETGSEPQSANLHIKLDQANIVLPLPDGLRFEGENPMCISLSFPNTHSTQQETNYANISSASAASHEEPNAESAEDKAAKKQLLLPSPSTPKKSSSSQYQTQWPIVGGDDLLLDTAEILNSKAFQDAFKPGIKRDIYIAGCSGLSELKKQLSIPIFKIGECGEGHIADRIRQQSKDQYGSYFKINGDWPVQDEGYNDYSALQFYLPDDLHPMSPVQPSTRGLTVTLPKGMSRHQFSRAFQKRLASCSWLEWRKTEDALAHFKRKNIDQDIIDRYTDYGVGGKSDIAQATELYCIRNQDVKDCRRLTAVIENVILEQMGLI